MSLVRWGHDLTGYLQLCQSKELLETDPETIELIALFGGKDRAEDYRYAGQNDIVAQLQWVRVVVGRLMENIEPRVIAWADSNGVALLPGFPTKLRYAIGKPPYSTKPVQLKLAPYLEEITSPSSDGTRSSPADPV